MDKPEFLYRGTPRKNVDMFDPKEVIGSGSLARQVVSATSERINATKFVVPIEKLRVAIGSLGNINYYLCADEEIFRKNDHGGAIYTLSLDGFTHSPEMGATVWTNPKSVKPLSMEEITSALETMINAGVKIYFVSPGTLEKFNQSGSHRLELLQGLTPENSRGNTSL